MIKGSTTKKAAITMADPRFYALAQGGLSNNNGAGPYLGTAIGGIGYDPGKALKLSYNGGTPVGPDSAWGLFVPKSNYDYDKWTCPGCGASARWKSGWTSDGYWSYWLYNASTNTYSYSGVGTSSRNLANGDRDVWNYMPGFSSKPLGSTFTTVSPP
jgi:hypothetical protein